MGSYSDSTSDSDDELPVFDFLQPGRHLCKKGTSHTEKPDFIDLGDSDGEDAAVSSTVRVDVGRCSKAADMMMISSDSDDDAPYVPLAQRLKQRQDNVISASTTVTNGKDAQQFLPSNLASTQLSCQNGFPHSEPPFLSFHQVRTVSHGALDGPEEAVALPRQWLPPKSVSSTGSTGGSPDKKKPAKRTAEEIQASREEALRRRQAREGQQKDKEALRLEQNRQKAERKALAETAKALRPEECIKHMVVAVDPGEEKS